MIDTSEELWCVCILDKRFSVMIVHIYWYPIFASTERNSFFSTFSKEIALNLPIVSALFSCTPLLLSSMMVLFLPPYHSEAEKLSSATLGTSHIPYGFQFGHWVDPDPSSPSRTRSPPSVLYHSFINSPLLLDMCPNASSFCGSECISCIYTSTSSFGRYDLSYPRRPKMKRWSWLGLRGYKWFDTGIFLSAFPRDVVARILLTS